MEHLFSSEDALAVKRLRAALLRAHAVPGRPRSAEDLARFLGPHTDPAEVLAVGAAAGTDVTVAGDTLVLTNTGLEAAREHPLPREQVRTRL